MSAVVRVDDVKGGNAALKEGEVVVFLLALGLEDVRGVVGVPGVTEWDVSGDGGDGEQD